MFLFRKRARLLKRGDTLAVLVSNITLPVDLEEKVDVFSLTGKLTQEEYDELTALLG